MRSKLINWILLLFSILLLINIVRTWKFLAMRGNVIRDIQNNLQAEKERQNDLKRQLARVESDQYTEQEARNKLNLGREGEIALLLPSISPIFLPTPTPVDTSTNWQKWVKLFL